MDMVEIVKCPKCNIFTFAYYTYCIACDVDLYMHGIHYDNSNVGKFKQINVHKKYSTTKFMCEFEEGLMECLVCPYLHTNGEFCYLFNVKPLRCDICDGDLSLQYSAIVRKIEKHTLNKYICCLCW